MKKYRTLLWLVIPALLWAPTLGAQDDEDDSTKVNVEVGVWDGSVEDSPDVVAEYGPEGGGLDLNLDLSTFKDWGSLIFNVRFLDEDDQDFHLEFDVDRAVRSDTEFIKMIHRLGHDPLHNLEAVTNHGRIVWHTDTAPDDEYQITYTDLRHRTEFQPRKAEDFTLGINYRRQDRRGLKQALVISHCDTCHVVSQSRPIDERTEDAGLDVQFALKNGGLIKASFNHRELSDGAPGLTLLFDDALQPELRIPVFDNRLQYDSAEGPQPVHRTPDTSKDLAKIEVTLPLEVIAFNASGVYSLTENEYTGLEASYNGYAFNVARYMKGDWRFRWRGRYYTIDNDDFFVDVNDRLGIAGPQGGRTYADIYGIETDFLRLSSLNRDVIESKVDFSRKFGGSQTVKFSWNFEQIDREHFEVAPGDTETTENVFGVSWWARPKEGLRVSAAVKHGEVDNPFMALDAIFSTLESDRVSSPFAPNSAQYFDFQNARIGDATASPESWDELRAALTYQSGNRLFSASYRFWDGENDSLDLTDWERQNQSFVLTYWAAPAETWSYNLSYAYHDSEVMFPVTIPIFDG